MLAAEERAATAEAHAKRLADEVKGLRAPYIEELKRLSGLLGLDTEYDLLMTVSGPDLGELPTEKLVSLQMAWQKRYDAANPPERQSTPAEPPAQTPEPQARPTRPVSLPS